MNSGHLPERSGPIRTCVGCRATDRQDALVRLVADVSSRRVQADFRRRMPGRGAYVHRDRTCVDRAVKGLSRALRASVSPRDLAAVRAVITDGDPAAEVTRAPGHADRDVVEDPPPHKA